MKGAPIEGWETCAACHGTGEKRWKHDDNHGVWDGRPIGPVTYVQDCWECSGRGITRKAGAA